MNSKVRKIHLIGNAHIDPVWLWRWEEGYAEVKATFRSALDRMNEFDRFVFTSACAAYYKWIEESDPDMFKEIAARIREGRWAIAGGWWIQPDCNIPSGESFARHGLYSQRYFLEKFGTMAKTGYNVDSFGHSLMLPQILKKSGMDAYIFMRPGIAENSNIPGPLFRWESPDGSSVLAYRIQDSYTTPPGNTAILKDKLQRAAGIADEKKYPVTVFYGVGNHGGGPTVSDLGFIEEAMADTGGEKYVMSSPDKYFADINNAEDIQALGSAGKSLPVHREDLQHHASGCYSTASEIKTGNRRSENILLATEKFAAVAHGILKAAYPGEKIRGAWETVMFNQFHDIMGGCSIKEAIQDASCFYGEALTTAAKVLNSALQKISWAVNTMPLPASASSPAPGAVIGSTSNNAAVNTPGTPLIIFNPLSWDVLLPVKVNKLSGYIEDDNGMPVEIQAVRGPQTLKTNKWNSLFVASVPAMGYRTYNTFNAGKQPDAVPARTSISQPLMLEVKENVLENSFTRLIIDKASGYLVSLYDKVRGIELLSGNGAVPVVIDISHCDTWAHKVFEFRNEVGVFSGSSVNVLESGPVRAMLRVVSIYDNPRDGLRSEIHQDFIMYKHKPDIEVQVKLDWHEKNKMLKLSFPVNVSKPKAIYEIPYGHIERPANGEEEPGQQWTCVSGMGINSEKHIVEYGLALINDCKYSFDIKENEMRMTVANSSVYADHCFDEGWKYRDVFCEHMDQGIQYFKYALLPFSGSFASAAATIYKKACELNTPALSVQTAHHSGLLPLVFQGIDISAKDIAAVTFKRAEDGDGYILRCCETSGNQVAKDTVIEMPFLNRKWNTCFSRFEIKTFRISDNLAKPVYEQNLLEMD